MAWDNSLKYGDPLTDEERKMIQIAYGLSERGLFSYHQLRKEFYAIDKPQYSVRTLRTFMYKVFKKLGINSLLELVLLVSKKDERIFA